MKRYGVKEKDNLTLFLYLSVSIKLLIYSNRYTSRIRYVSCGSYGRFMIYDDNLIGEGSRVKPGEGSCN